MSYNKDVETVDTLINDHKKSTKVKKRKRNIKVIFVICIMLLISFLFYLYMTTSISKISKVTISGNSYLSSNEVFDLSGIDYDDYYLMTFASSIEKSIKSHPLIKDVKINSSFFDRSLDINITEHKIVGYYDSNDYLFLLEDGTVLDDLNDEAALIRHLPVIVGFDTEDMQKELAKAFEHVEDRILSKISEIHQYEVSYDNRMIEVIMMDGNRIYSSIYALNNLNNYYEIVEVLHINNGCLFINDATNTYYSTPCEEIKNAQNMDE